MGSASLAAPIGAIGQQVREIARILSGLDVLPITADVTLALKTTLARTDVQLPAAFRPDNTPWRSSHRGSTPPNDENAPRASFAHRAARGCARLRPHGTRLVRRQSLPRIFHHRQRPHLRGKDQGLRRGRSLHLPEIGFGQRPRPHRSLQDFSHRAPTPTAPISTQEPPTPPPPSA